MTTEPRPALQPLRSASERQGAKRELARRAMEYIQAHSTEKFSLEAIAGVLFVDRIYLSKCFKSVTGTTLLKYHNQVRCEAASRLLTGSDLSMELIAVRVGFATPSHFARVFRSVYGCSPSSFRKTQGGE